MSARIPAAVALVLTGSLLFPVALSVAERPLTDQQKNAAIVACGDKFVQCQTLCTAHSAIPQLQANCVQDCILAYNRCTGAVARRVPKGQTPVLATPPPVAPPRPTPRGIVPERVDSVSPRNATSAIVPGASAAPALRLQRKPSRRSDEPQSEPRSSATPPSGAARPDNSPPRPRRVRSPRD